MEYYLIIFTFSWTSRNIYQTVLPVFSKPTHCLLSCACCQAAKSKSIFLWQHTCSMWQFVCQLHADEYQTTTTLSGLKQRVTICHISLCWLVSCGQFFYCTCYWLGSFTYLHSSGRSPKWAVSWNIWLLLQMVSQENNQDFFVSKI